MTFLLKLHCAMFDHPRFLHQHLTKIHTQKDLDSFARSSYVSKSFKPVMKDRLAQFNHTITQLQQHAIEWVDIHNESYPNALHNLHDPPLCLFYKGDIRLLNQTCLSIVGTRRPSVMAKYRVQSLFQSIPRMVIVSGGAMGIDALAHQSALHYHYPTVAILASGLDKMTPATNRSIFKQMLASSQGCIASECPPGFPTKPYYFPQRNRLIAALSHRLLVVEAGQKSGAVITANIAAQLGIEVGAMIGSYNAPQSAGCHALINDGATLIGDTQNLHDFLPDHRPTIPFNANHSSSPILTHIPNEPIHIDDLAAECNLPFNEFIEEITTLSLNGHITILPGQRICHDNTK